MTPSEKSTLTPYINNTSPNLNFKVSEPKPSLHTLLLYDVSLSTLIGALIP